MPTRLDHDEELLEALREREPAAAERLVTTYGHRAYRLATRITGNRQDAEEVVQNAFWGGGSEDRQVQAGGRLRLVGFRIVANAAYQKLRCRQNRRRDVPRTRYCRYLMNKPAMSCPWPIGHRA